MAINANQLVDLVKMLRQTHEVELSCPECLEELDNYVQNILDRQPVEGILYRVREHLEACPFCNDEFNLVLETIKAIEAALESSDEIRLESTDARKQERAVNHEGDRGITTGR